MGFFHENAFGNLQNISDFVQAPNPVSWGETECEILQNIIGEVKQEIVSTLIFNISQWRNFCGMDKKYQIQLKYPSSQEWFMPTSI